MWARLWRSNGGVKLRSVEDSIENVIVWLVVTLGGSFGGSYLGAYFKKKGENLATHEDIDKLVEQVGAVTKTTKEIEAKISDEVWDRQRKRELIKTAPARSSCFLGWHEGFGSTGPVL
jgi:predicted alpha/beta-fold hydrolase